MFDIIIISVPGTISKTPPAAPALLKASVESAGFSCRTIDFNIRLHQDFSNTNDLETYFITGLNVEQEKKATELVDKWTKELCALSPKYIGISVFTFQNRIATELFCKAIRQNIPNTKIILGGQGLTDGGIGSSLIDFGKRMFDTQLTDFYIRSEGEISLVELLKNNIEYPGINSGTFKQIDNLDSLPFPNYDDYDLESYDKNIHLPITGSRGCVRSCSFCDIHEHWQYRYRSGQNIADEMQYLKKKYNIGNFNFSDSLINGNLKEFKKFIKILADYNNNNNEKITWSSQFIVRSEKIVDEQHWKDIADSGVKNLFIGVETGSDSVRSHMNKKFTNQDLDQTLKMLDKHNIHCMFLMIVGYPTETDDNFQETLDMFTRYQPLARRIIRTVTIGSTLAVLPGTPLYKHAAQYNIDIDKFENNWVANDNLNLTLEKRLHRRSLLIKHLKVLGYDLNDSSEHIVQILEKNQPMFNKRLELKKIIKIKQQVVDQAS